VPIFERSPPINFIKMGAESENAARIESARAMYETLSGAIELAPLVDAKIPHDPKNERHLLITRDIIEKHTPKLLPKYDRTQSDLMRVPAHAPGITRNRDEVNAAVERNLHDRFNPYRVSKFTTALTSAREIANTMGYPELEKIVELSDTFKDRFKGAELVTKEFAKEAYATARKVAERFERDR
jgi:hypothetical protein